MHFFLAESSIHDFPFIRVMICQSFEKKSHYHEVDSPAVHLRCFCVKIAGWIVADNYWDNSQSRNDGKKLSAVGRCRINENNYIMSKRLRGFSRTAATWQNGWLLLFLERIGESLWQPRTIQRQNSSLLLFNYVKKFPLRCCEKICN